MTILSTARLIDTSDCDMILVKDIEIFILTLETKKKIQKVIFKRRISYPILPFNRLGTDRCVMRVGQILLIFLEKNF